MAEGSSHRAIRLAEIRRALGTLKLSESYLDAFLANPSGDLPYHGEAHGLAVAMLAHRGGRICQLRHTDRQALLLAALFHDYGYSVAAGEPANIAAAAKAAGQIIAELGDSSLIGPVQELIHATEVPHGTTSSRAAEVIQDADLLMISQPDFEVFLAGLREEQPGLNLDPRFPGEDALNTSWGKRVYRTAIELNGQKIPDPWRALTVGNTLHTQTLSSRGFLVDSSISAQLEALWAAGYSTAFSCGGDDPGEHSLGYLTPVRGYIAFVDATEEQRTKLRRAAEAIGQSMEEVTSTDGLEAVVLRFSRAEAERVFAELL